MDDYITKLDIGTKLYIVLFKLIKYLYNINFNKK